MAEIVLFGGSFDPPHLGHLFVIQQAFELIPDIHELWLLPTYRHTFDKNLTPAPNRLEMCQLLMKELPSNLQSKVKLSSIEIDHQTSGSTYQTLQILKNELKIKNLEFKINFLMGSDQLINFAKWENYQELLNAMHFYVYPRAGYSLKNLSPNMTPLLSPTQVITNLSSTLIKTRLEQQLSIQNLVPDSIAAYIKDNQLYV